MLKLSKLFLALICIFLPNGMKIIIYKYFFGYKIKNNVKIGASFILCDNVYFGENSKIGSFNFIKGLNSLTLEKNSIIGNLNWITGFDINRADFFNGIIRNPSLFVGDHAAITNRHYIDCTNSVSIGRFSTFAGVRSQILTHSIDIYKNIQDSKPVVIGEYCFLGSGVCILGGSVLPSFCVLGAGAVLAKKFDREYSLYGGVPARWISEITINAPYFSRDVGVVR